MTDRMIESYEGEWELAKAQRLLAEAAEHLKPRDGETDAEFDARHTAWLQHQAAAPDAPPKPKPAPIVVAADEGLYDPAAREQLLADLRAGTVKGTPLSEQRDGLYTDAARAKLLAEARQFAAKPTPNTPRG